MQFGTREISMEKSKIWLEEKTIEENLEPFKV